MNTQIDPKYGITVLWRGRQQARLRIRTINGDRIRCIFTTKCYPPHVGTISINGNQSPFKLMTKFWDRADICRLIDDSEKCLYSTVWKPWRGVQILDISKQIVAEGTIKGRAIVVNGDCLSWKMTKKGRFYNRIYKQRFQFDTIDQPPPQSLYVYILTLFYYWRSFDNTSSGN